MIRVATVGSQGGRTHAHVASRTRRGGFSRARRGMLPGLALAMGGSLAGCIPSFPEKSSGDGGEPDAPAPSGDGGAPSGSEASACVGDVCVACNATSCVDGCCGAHGCVTSGQTVSECGTGRSGAACVSCPSMTGGTATCASNQCGVSCGAGYHACGSACGDDTSPETCGTSCTPCSLANAVAICTSAGSCAIGSCVSGWGDCNGVSSDGCEAHVAVDPTQCGASCTDCSVANGTPGCSGGQCTVASCTASYGDCDGIAANGCETNLLVSTANCGACGHDCLFSGSTCTSGQCSPVVVYSTTTTTEGPVLDALNLYWADEAVGLLTQPIAGGTVLTLYTGHPTAMVLGPDAIYFAEDDTFSIRSAPKTVANSSTVIYSNSASNAYSMAIDSTYLYWTENDADVVRGPIVGGTISTLVSVSTDPNTIAVDASNLYWTDYTGDTVTETPLNGSAPTTLFKNQTTSEFAPNGIVIDTGSVYWGGYFGNAVMSAPIGVASVTTLATNQSYVCDLALDSDYVYWTNSGGAAGAGSVMKVAKGGAATPITLASGLTAPCGLAVDGTAVYWTTSDGGGGLSKVAK